MYFTSYEFLAFLAVLFVLYYVLPRRLQWPLLLLASGCFYFAAGWYFLIYILVTAGTAYFTTCMMTRNQNRQEIFLRENNTGMTKEEKKSYKEKQKKIRRRWLVFCILLHLGILAVVKYHNFFISNVNGIANALGWGKSLSFVNIAVPLGISFYTLQVVGYLTDVYRGTVKAEKNFFRLTLFISFFPQLIQGPISRYEDLSKTLYGNHSFDGEMFCSGLLRILWGFFKKLVVADRLLVGVGAMTAAPDTYRGAYTLVIMVLYTIELYADFTGGIDITIGIAQSLGIVVKENFDRPYFSASLKEYWRRWHISMCSWFRDYVFYPVSTSKAIQKFSKFTRKHFGNKAGKFLPVCVSSFVVWLATGIWHGASWNFVVWGLLNWFVLMASEQLEPLYASFHERFRFSNGNGYHFFQIARTFLLICILNLFDCYESVGTIFGLFASLFTVPNWEILWNGSLFDIGLDGFDYGIVAVGIIIFILVDLWKKKGDVRELLAAKPYAVRALVWFGLFFSVILLGAYGIGYDASQFIYNRF